MKRGSWRRVPSAVVATALFSLAGAAPARAAYPVLGPGYYQRDWLTTSSSGEFESRHTILPDGSLLLLVEPRRDYYELRRFQPEDSRLSDGEVAGRVGNVDDVKSVAGRIYFSQVYDTVNSYHRLLELDSRTGHAGGELFRWQWAFDIVVDPVTKGFVLFDCPASMDCFTTKGQPAPGVNGTDDYQRVVALDPVTGRKTDLVRDTGRPLGTQYAMALSADGQRIFVGRKESGIDVYERGTGRLLSTIATSAFVARIRFGPPYGCFANRIVYTLDDGSVWTVDPAMPGAPSRLVAATGEALQFNGKELAFDLQGRLVSSEGSLADGHVTVIDCKPIPPPRNARPAADRPPQQRPQQSDPPPTSGGRPGGSDGAAGGAPGPAAPPGSAQTATATQPVSQPVQAGSFGQAMQGASAPQAGLADAPEDTPQLGFSARARRPDPPTPVALWAVALLLAAAGAAVHRRLDDPDLTQQPRRATP
jgi:hypothetical protein